MSAELDLVLLWHMHQPDYRDAGGGPFMLPWVYLHALKDYSDMAAHLERHPQVRAVVNFVPVLVEQLEDYVRQFDEGRIRDPLLGLLQEPDLDRVEPHERALILDSCFHNNHDTMLSPYPQYRRLHELFSHARPRRRRSLRLPFGRIPGRPADLVSPGLDRRDRAQGQPAVQSSDEQGRGVPHGDRLQLFEAIGVILRGVLDRYRALAARGQIELSTTPHTHPIGPLLIDFAAAREAMPLVFAACVAGLPGRGRKGACAPA